MSQVNTELFLWMAAGATPTPWLLATGILVAQYGAWLCLAIILWAALRHPAERPRIMATLLLCAAASIIAHAMAAKLALPRPFTLGLSPAWLFHGDRGALPSTHATVMAVAVFMFMMKPALRRAGLALAAAMIATGWARTYVGVHFPADIAAGIALGLALAGAAEAVWRAASARRQGTRPAQAEPEASMLFSRNTNPSQASTNGFGTTP